MSVQLYIEKEREKERNRGEANMETWRDDQQTSRGFIYLATASADDEFLVWVEIKHGRLRLLRVWTKHKEKQRELLYPPDCRPAWVVVAALQHKTDPGTLQGQLRPTQNRLSSSSRQTPLFWLTRLIRLKWRCYNSLSVRNTSRWFLGSEISENL